MVLCGCLYARLFVCLCLCLCLVLCLLLCFRLTITDIRYFTISRELLKRIQTVRMRPLMFSIFLDV